MVWAEPDSLAWAPVDVSDELRERLWDDGPTAVLVSATLTTCTSRSLAEAHPVLGFVCERYIAHWRQNRDSFHNLTVSQDGATRFSRADMSTDYEFLPEHRALLKPYRNLLGAQRPAVASGRGKGG